MEIYMLILQSFKYQSIVLTDRKLTSRAFIINPLRDPVLCIHMNM